MASYLGHLTFSTALGAGWGCAGALYLGMDWGPVFLGAGLTALGGLLPDLDSDSGVPVRELFGVGAAAADKIHREDISWARNARRAIALVQGAGRH